MCGRYYESWKLTFPILAVFPLAWYWAWYANQWSVRNRTLEEKKVFVIQSLCLNSDPGHDSM